jgi:hypothetical protein
MEKVLKNVCEVSDIQPLSGAVIFLDMFRIQGRVQLTVHYDFMQRNCSILNVIDLCLLYHHGVQSLNTSYIYLQVYGL